MSESTNRTYAIPRKSELAQTSPACGASCPTKSNFPNHLLGVMKSLHSPIMSQTNQPIFPQKLCCNRLNAIRAAIIFLSGGAVMAATNMAPVAVTGFNRDVVVENTASGPPFTSVAMEFNAGEGTAYYQSGLAGHIFGLPVSGLFINGNDATTFQFQPYTTNNALVLSSDTAITSGTLTLTPPATFSKIAILANSGNGDSIGSAAVTLNFLDGTAFVTNYYAPDWFFNNSTASYTVALQGVERLNLFSGVVDGAPAEPRFYQTTLPLSQWLGTSNRPISSITFNQAVMTDGISLGVPGALAGDSDQAAAFDGFLGVMTVPFGPVLSLTAPFTVEAWLKPATTRTSDTDVVCALSAGHFGNPRSGWVLYQGQSGWNFRIFNQNGFNPSLNIIGGPPPTIGIWQHVVAAYDGTNGFVYVNGVLRTNQVAAGFVANTDGALTCGMRNDGNFAWGGAEDEVAIYTNVLSAPDILAHYQNGTNAAPSQTYQSLILARNPLFYFRLDETNLASPAVNQGTTGSKYKGIYGKLTGATAVYAISGLPVSAVSLATVTNARASVLSAETATIGGAVVSTGGETPQVSLYYGPVDGGADAASWSNHITLGFQNGTFTQTINGLSQNTTYYFTARALNSAGAAWAAPSQSFTMPAALPPVVTNLPATEVEATFATLNGHVLFTGNEPTTVAIYYGLSDGGTNAAAWSNSAALGFQAGKFAQTVSGLLPNTTYFFTSRAVNSVGLAWASPSQSFTSAGTNPAVAVLTQHNDNNRSGMNLNETILNVSNVNTNTFGLLYTRPVDDQIYAQPLLMTNVNLLGRGTRNIIIVATVNDTIYAYDADNPSATAPYWTNSFINPPDIVPPNNADESAIGACGGNYLDFSGKFGIVGTPVIDPIAGTIYLVARTKEFGTNFVQRLHALDLTTGLDRTNSPIVITATYPGTGAGSSGGLLPFDPLRHNQRAALALVNGVVYISWASHCDNGPYHGWLIGYDASTLQQVALFNDTPNGSNGGIWMSGQGPAADDAGNIYLTVGNGSVDATDYGESFLKLAPPTNGTTMTVTGFFIPTNWASLNIADQDLGTAGLLLIPGTSLAISGGKSGDLYMVNRDTMGGIGTSLQTWSLGSGIYGGPVWWTGPNGSFMYVWPSSESRLRQYQFTGAFNTIPYTQGATLGGFGTPGGILSLSANGANAGSGILWATVNKSASANQSVVAGALHAYNAQNVGFELWNSDKLARDSLGNLAKFVPPTVANGKVYVATFSGRLNVYGLSLTAANLNAATLQNQPVSIALAKLLALAFDPYSLPLTATVTSLSTNGGTVVLGGNAITYTPPSDYIGPDRFAYTISDGQGGFASAYVFVDVMVPNQLSANMLPPSAEPGGIAISFAGIPGLTYSLQRAPTVTGPWTTIATVTVPDGGIATYLDATPPLGDAFYRTTYP
jgi:hypothetical protein